jgi:hypothetical protein
MPNTSIDNATIVAGYLRRLIEVLRQDDGVSWRLLRAVTAGRAAVMEFEGVRLRLQGRAAPDYDLLMEYCDDMSEVNFRTDMSSVSDIVAGRLTLDHALTDGRIFVRAGLSDLLDIYRLAILILAESACNAELRRLWMEFEQEWPSPSPGQDVLPLERQRPQHGALIVRIPAATLRVEVESEKLKVKS